MLIAIDTSRIRDGELSSVKEGMKRLVDFVEQNEPDTIAYSVYISDDGSSMTVVQVHPNSESMEFHMQAASSIFSGFAGMLELERVDVYGDASPQLIERLEAKAALLGGAPVSVHELFEGVSKIG